MWADKQEPDIIQAERTVEILNPYVRWCWRRGVVRLLSILIGHSKLEESRDH